MSKKHRQHNSEGHKGQSDHVPGHFKQRFNQAQQSKYLSLAAIAPNMVTVLALCCGMTSISLALSERWDLAVIVILLAGFFDGVDGRVARLLGSTSRFGAELDSLSDLLNFGAAPALVIYLRGLNQLGRVGWGIVLFFTVCMALRLARFNTRDIEGNAPTWSHEFATGVPAPAGAFLALMPIIIQQEFTTPFLYSPYFYAVFLVATGGLLVSRIPTFAFKKVQVPHRLVLPLMLTVLVVAVSFYSQPWLTLFAIGLAYVGLIPASIHAYGKVKKEMESGEDSKIPEQMVGQMVGTAGFEPTTPIPPE